jgi:hypothetical protein
LLTTGVIYPAAGFVNSLPPVSPYAELPRCAWGDEAKPPFAVMWLE